MGKRECALCRVSFPLDFDFPIDQEFRDKHFGYEFKAREREEAIALSKNKLE